jgi:hypothetical protein
MQLAIVIEGGPNVVSASPRSTSACTDSSIGEWKACDTGIRRAFWPAAISRSTERSTASVGPEITFWRGWLRLARMTWGSRWGSISSAAHMHAAIAPWSPCSSAMALPRRATKRMASAGSTAPASALAVNSPSEWPSTTEGFTPNRARTAATALPTANIAGWAICVSVSAASSASSAYR